MEFLGSRLDPNNQNRPIILFIYLTYCVFKMKKKKAESKKTVKANICSISNILSVSISIGLLVWAISHGRLNSLNIQNILFCFSNLDHSYQFKIFKNVLMHNYDLSIHQIFTKFQFIIIIFIFSWRDMICFLILKSIWLDFSFCFY